MCFYVPGSELGEILCAGMVAHGKNSFVEEYTGNVAFYTYLAQRFRACPIILKRNLSYRQAEYAAERKRLNGDNLTAKSLQDRCTAAKVPRNSTTSTDQMASGATSALKAAAPLADSQPSGANSQLAHAGEDGDAQVQKRGSQSRKAAMIFRFRHQQGSQEWLGYFSALILALISVLTAASQRAKDV
jgi:hypothetical protein